MKIREAVYPDDAEAVTEVWNAANPAGPRTPEQLVREGRQRDPAYPFRECVAIENGRVVGMARLGSSDADRAFQGRLFVHPEFRRQGIGTALYQDLLDWARPHQPLCRVTQRDDASQAAGRTFLEKRGWQANHRRLELTADLNLFDLKLYDGLISRLEGEGIQFRPLSELMSDPQYQQWLYELDWALFLDVPLDHTPTKRPFDRWYEQELASPALRPALSVVALDLTVNDPLTGPLLGWVTTEERSPGYYIVGMTGVLRSQRRRGLAKALKAWSMQLLQQAGVNAIHTMNDENNAPIVHLNEQLGFERTATIDRYELNLGEA